MAGNERARDDPQRTTSGGGGEQSHAAKGTSTAPEHHVAAGGGPAGQDLPAKNVVGGPSAHQQARKRTADRSGQGRNDQNGQSWLGQLPYQMPAGAEPDKVAAASLSAEVDELWEQLVHLSSNASPEISTWLDTIALQLEEVERRGTGHTVDPPAIGQVREDLQNVRRAISGQVNNESPAGYEVYVPVDSEQFPEALDWLIDATRELDMYPGGSDLANQFISRIKEGPGIRLQPSPRGLKAAVNDTATMRGEVHTGLRAGQFETDQELGFAEAAGDQAWPRTSAGESWHVDHIVELWQGGADDLDNYAPLHPALHRLKTAIMTRFRWRFRERNIQRGEQNEVPGGISI